MRILIVLAIAAALIGGGYAPIQAAGKAKSGSDKAASAHEKGGKLDLNTATQSELRGVGFTETEARKITGDRPYKSKDELVRKNIISKSKYDKVKDRIVARQETAKKS